MTTAGRHLHLVEDLPDDPLDSLKKNLAELERLHAELQKMVAELEELVS